MRIYELYKNGRLSNKLKDYHRLTSDLYHVAARSIRQAFWCVHNMSWTDGQGSGVLEILPAGDNKQWYRWDGSVDDVPRYEYKRTFPTKRERQRPQIPPE